MADDDGIARESRRFRFDDIDQLRHMRAQHFLPVSIEGGGIPQRGRRRQWAKARIQMVEPRIDEFDRQRLHSQ